MPFDLDLVSNSFGDRGVKFRAFKVVSQVVYGMGATKTTVSDLDSKSTVRSPPVGPEFGDVEANRWRHFSGVVGCVSHPPGNFFWWEVDVVQELLNSGSENLSKVCVELKLLELHGDAPLYGKVFQFFTPFGILVRHNNLVPQKRINLADV